MKSRKGAFTSVRTTRNQITLQSIEGNEIDESAKSVMNSVASDIDTDTPTNPSTPPQLIEFVEPKTNTNVILIGTMHYNPTSIQMVKNTIQNKAQQNELGSVLVESCDIRWNTTMELLETPRGKLFAPFVTSEMKAASDEALKYGRPCVLGDQRINATGTSLGKTLKRTAVDIVSPFNGGWNRIYTEFNEAAEVALPTGDGYLSAWAILDPRLLITAPVSFVKYPISFLARNPVTTTIVFSFIGFLTYLDASGGGGSVAFADMSLQQQLLNSFASILLSSLEIILFGRILVQVLLAERNEIIAKNILDQCEIYSSSNQKSIKNSSSGGDNGMNNSLIQSNLSKIFSFFGGNQQGENEKRVEKVQDTDIDKKVQAPIYVPGSIQGDSVWRNDGKEKTVIAVLGMAHCNGIVKLLKEELIA